MPEYNVFIDILYGLERVYPELATNQCSMSMTKYDENKLREWLHEVADNFVIELTNHIEEREIESEKRWEDTVTLPVKAEEKQ